MVAAAGPVPYQGGALGFRSETEQAVCPTLDALGQDQPVAVPAKEYESRVSLMRYGLRVASPFC